MTVGYERQFGFAAASPSLRAFIALCLLFVVAGWSSARAAPSIDNAAPALILSELGGDTFDLGKL